jgi:hypothetical protein
MDSQKHYRVVVRSEPQGCTWIVERQGGRAMSGHAPDRASADRRGAFAAAALHSLDRIRQRSF